MTAFDYRNIILEELQKRKERNPSYSLSVFATYLGISKTALSQVLASKRNLSKRSALRVAERLSFSSDTTKTMLAQISGMSERRFDDHPYLTLGEDKFSLIADWYHYAILNLAKIKSNKSDPYWIAKRLGITPLEARSALARLQRLDLLTIEKGKLKRKTSSLTTTNEVPSAALRKYHGQNLQLAEQSLHRDSLSERQITSITMAIDSRRLERAKEMVIRFRDRMSVFLEAENPDSVYTFGLQLFPVVKRMDKSC